ncbi:5-bromo-4-chloroindolyl phosphate hydrolysis family protein [Aestuariibius sp. 2305UL40-4]|uniref:5-bromo-4-chloroindolyl phosphate hydrolysis family protein n=1 Tax=Aestuariibius violaceus TaxID=3234132 RepID=UPI00345EDC55
MAKRFGGKYSPGAGGDQTSSPQFSRGVDPAGARANLMFLPPVAVVFTSLTSGPVTLVTGLAAGGLLALGAYLIRDGLRAEAEYNARAVARRPAIPRKLFASALTAAGIGLAAFSKDAGLIGAILYGLAAGGLHIAAFGIDPLRDKRVEGVDTFQQDRVAKVVDEAEAHLAQMQATIDALRDRRLTERVADFQATARRMIRTVEEDPRDLTGARKFLGVYLLGARDATAKFAQLYSRKKDEEARADYEALLDDLQGNFAQKTETLLLDDRSDMDIEIKVLRDRLQREGALAQNQESSDV